MNKSLGIIGKMRQYTAWLCLCLSLSFNTAPYAHAWGPNDPFKAWINSASVGNYFNPSVNVRATTTLGDFGADYNMNPVTGECVFYFGLFRMCARMVAPNIEDPVTHENYGIDPVTEGSYGNDTAQRAGFCPDCDNDPNPSGPGNTSTCPSNWRTDRSNTSYLANYPYSKAFCPFPKGDPRRFVKTARAMMCVYSDPGDLTDIGTPTNPGYMPCNSHTPKDQSGNAGCAPNMEAASTMGAVAGGIAALALTTSWVPVIGQIIAGVLAILALFSSLYPYINYDVHGNIGCVEIPPAPNPPPWCSTIGVGTASASVRAICAAGQVSTATQMCVTASTPSTFEVPRVRVTLNRQKPRCTNNGVPGVNANCVSFWYGTGANSGTITNSTLSICPDMGGCNTTTGNGCHPSPCVWKPTNMLLSGTVQVLYQAENGVLKPSAIDAGPYSDMSLNYGSSSPGAEIVQLNDPNAAAVSTMIKRTFKTYADSTTNANSICVQECVTSGTGCSSSGEVKNIGCVNRPPTPLPTVSTSSFSNRTAPLLTVNVGSPAKTGTLCLTGKCPAILASPTVVLYGKTFSLTAQDNDGNTISAGSGNNYTGATKICLSGYTPTGQMLVRTVSQTYNGVTSWVPSTLASDVILSNYVVPNNTCPANSICNCGPDIPSGCTNGTSCRAGVACSQYPGGGCRSLPIITAQSNSPTTTCATQYNTIHGSSVQTTTVGGVTTETIMPAKEALRAKTISEAGLCVAIPAQ